MFHAVRSIGGLNTPSPPPITSFGSHLGDWMKQSGDQVLTMPNGTYDTANIDWGGSAHAATTGPYKGWLILVAQTQGGVTIDGSLYGLKIGMSGQTPKDLRIMFVGMKFTNATFHIYNSSKLRWWYTEHTYPASAWRTQYIAAGGNPNAAADNNLRVAMPNYTAAGIRALGDVGPYVDNIGIYGSYFHELGDDAIFLQGASNGEVKGCQMVDVHHHNVFSPNSGSYFHCDCLQSEWGSNWSVTDNFFGGHIQFEAFHSNLTNWTFNNNWHGGSPDLGFTYDTAPSGVQRDITGCVVSNSQWFNNGQYYGFSANPAYWSDYDVFQYGFGNAPTGLTFSNITHATPSGISVVGGLIQDLPLQATARAHASNPANIWQTTNPYSSWSTYFGSNWP